MVNFKAVVLFSRKLTAFISQRTFGDEKMIRLIFEKK